MSEDDYALLKQLAGDQRVGEWVREILFKAVLSERRGPSHHPGRAARPPKDPAQPAVHVAAGEPVTIVACQRQLEGRCDLLGDQVLGRKNIVEGHVERLCPHHAPSPDLQQPHRDHPQEGRIFDEAMTAFSHAAVPAILEAYDFSRFNRIADIGGGHGHLLRAVLRAAPAATGVVFDLPHVVEQAALEPAERLRFEAGSFFDEPLPICDTCLIMGVLQDWNDEDAKNILRAVRRVAPSDATVMIIETIVPEDPARN